jgi:hypothetical protein
MRAENLLRISGPRVRKMEPMNISQIYFLGNEK